MMRVKYDFKWKWHKIHNTFTIILLNRANPKSIYLIWLFENWKQRNSVEKKKQHYITAFNNKLVSDIESTDRVVLSNAKRK